jgi:hypothetical protein
VKEEKIILYVTFKAAALGWLRDEAARMTMGNGNSEGLTRARCLAKNNQAVP